jgi:opine dehydrogenase
LPTGVFPAIELDRVLATIGQVFPGVIEPCGDVLSAALMNSGPIIHPPLIVMNAGPLEHFGRWDIHNEGTQPSVRRVTDALDAERMAIREGLGYGAPHFPLADHCREDGDEWMYRRKVHSDLTSSGDWREKIDLTHHRYMVEDTKLGLSLMISAAEHANVAVPLTRAFLEIGGRICGEDFMAKGRTLSSLGYGALVRAGLQHFLETGFV